MSALTILSRSLLGFALFAVGAARAEWVWSFDTDPQGWTVADLHTFGPYHPPIRFYSLSQGSVGGYPGGHVYRGDPSSNSFAFSLPLEVMPEGTQLVGGRLEFCLRSNQHDWTSEAYVILGAPQTTLLAAIPVPGSSWSSYALDLNPENFSVEGGGAVDAALFQAVIDNLEGLYIMAEYGSGVETTYLDTVRLRQACVPLSTPDVMAQVAGTPELPLVLLSWVPVVGAHSYEILTSDLYWQTSQSLGVTTNPQWLLTPVLDGKAAYRVIARCD